MNGENTGGALAVVPVTDFPWPFETPPMRAWTHVGMLCATAKSPLYGVNGYVRIPEGSALYAVPYDDLDVDVSGGLTYGCFAREAMPKLGLRAVSCGVGETNGWVGFDTQHAWDHWDREIVEDLGQRTDLLLDDWSSNSRYWTLQDVVDETERLAEQLAALEPVDGAR